MSMVALGTKGACGRVPLCRPLAHGYWGIWFYGVFILAIGAPYCAIILSSLIGPKSALTYVGGAILRHWGAISGMEKFVVGDGRIMGDSLHPILCTHCWMVWCTRVHTYSWTVRVFLLALVKYTSALVRLWVVRRKGCDHLSMDRTVRDQARMVRLCVKLWVYPKLVEEVVIAR